MEENARQTKDGWICTTYRKGGHSDYAKTYKCLYCESGSSSDEPWYWVAVMLDDSIMVVLGSEGDCGEEPVVAGPFATVTKAKRVAKLLKEMGVV
jgi:hypothetical protein